MLSHVLLIVSLAVCLSFASAACPDLTTLRTEFVKSSSFSVSKLSGLWYEVAYHDIAQVRETCQTYVKGEWQRQTARKPSGFSEVFNFAYNQTGPGSLNLFYADTPDQGVYNRFADYPKINQFLFPSVIVDATVSKDGQSYSILSEFLCYEVGPVTYQEIRVGSREKTISTLDLLAAEKTLRDLGIEFKNLQKVDHTECA